MHRHESPVFGVPVVYETGLIFQDDVVKNIKYMNSQTTCEAYKAVFKPSGMPVHPTSHYN